MRSSWAEDRQEQADNYLDAQVSAQQDHRDGTDETPRETGRFEESWGRQEAMLP